MNSKYIVDLTTEERADLDGRMRGGEIAFHHLFWGTSSGAGSAGDSEDPGFPIRQPDLRPGMGRPAIQARFIQAAFSRAVQPGDFPLLLALLRERTGANRGVEDAACIGMVPGK